MEYRLHRASIFLELLHLLLSFLDELLSLLVLGLNRLDLLLQVLDLGIKAFHFLLEVLVDDVDAILLHRLGDIDSFLVILLITLENVHVQSVQNTRLGYWSLNFSLLREFLLFLLLRSFTTSSLRVLLVIIISTSWHECHLRILLLTNERLHSVTKFLIELLLSLSLLFSFLNPLCGRGSSSGASRWLPHSIDGNLKLLVLFLESLVLLKLHQDAVLKSIIDLSLLRQHFKNLWLRTFYSNLHTFALLLYDLGILILYLQHDLCSIFELVFDEVCELIRVIVSDGQHLLIIAPLVIQVYMNLLEPIHLTDKPRDMSQKLSLPDELAV